MHSIFKALTYYFFGEKTSRNAIVCCGIIIAGFLLGIDQEKGLGKCNYLLDDELVGLV